MSKTIAPQTILAEAQRTADGETSAFSVWDTPQVDLLVHVSEMTGTDPTLRVAIEATDQKSPASDDDYFSIQTLPLITVAGNYRTTITEGLARLMRVSYTITGTFSDGQGITFEIRMVKHYPD